MSCEKRCLEVFLGVIKEIILGIKNLKFLWGFGEKWKKGSRRNMMKFSRWSSCQKNNLERNCGVNFELFLLKILKSLKQNKLSFRIQALKTTKNSFIKKFKLSIWQKFAEFDLSYFLGNFKIFFKIFR
jgi:hypothetical protein